MDTTSDASDDGEETLTTLSSSTQGHGDMSSSKWTLNGIVASSNNFKEIPSVDVSQLSNVAIADLVKSHEASGIPLMMQNFHKMTYWDKDLFSPEWLHKNEGQSLVEARDVRTRKDRSFTLGEYLRYACQATPEVHVDETELWYAKDALCPEPWRQWMLENLPGYSLPLGNGDLYRLLAPEDRAETLMTYFGVGDTFTPAHKDSCASVGQNLMVHTEEGASSFWFMTSESDSNKASQYWRRLGHELDLESHVASIEQLHKAPFTVYIAQQRIGDFIIVPPRSCHQVINCGGMTMKLSWSRMIQRSLELALNLELPVYQRACRPETYRVKAVITAVLEACLAQLDSNSPITSNGVNPTSLIRALVPLFERMLVETYDANWRSYPPCPQLNGETCSCCGADLWQSAMVCDKCHASGSDEPSSIIICAPCYVDGRSCSCSLMHPVQKRPFTELLDLANACINVLSRDANRIRALSESNLTSETAPPMFRVACFLQKYRQAILRPSWARQIFGVDHIGKTKHPSYHQATILCRSCHSRHCWYHIVEKSQLHLVHLVTTTDEYANLQKGNLPNFTNKSIEVPAYHNLHKQASVDASPSDLNGKWKKWLPRLAMQVRCGHLPKESVRLGWYDGVGIPGIDENVMVVDEPPSNPSERSTSRRKRSYSSDDDFEPKLLPTKKARGRESQGARKKQAPKIIVDTTVSMTPARRAQPRGITTDTLQQHNGEPGLMSGVQAKKLADQLLSMEQEMRKLKQELESVKNQQEEERARNLGAQEELRSQITVLAHRKAARYSSNDESSDEDEE